MKRWKWSLALALCLLLAGGLALAETVLGSGECGTGMTWRFIQGDDGLRTLEISGKGAVTETPWDEEFDMKGIRADYLVLNEGVTSVPEYAFCTTLNTGAALKMPSTMRHIGAHAFSGVMPVSVTLNEGLLSVGACAFGNGHCCPTIVIPRSVTDIGYQAFPEANIWAYSGSEGAQWCKDWNIPFREIGDGMSNRDQMLKKLLDAIAAADDVPMRYRQPVIDTVKTMSLTAAQMSDLADYVAEEYAALRAAMADNELDSLEVYDFATRFQTKMADIGVTVSFAPQMFGNYWGVKLGVKVNGETLDMDVYRRGGSWYLSRRPSGTTSYYTWEETGDGLVITGYTGSATALTVPATLNGKAVKGVTGDAGKWPSNLTTLTLSEGISFIGTYAFANLEKLTTVNLPKSLEVINDSAFDYCPKIATIDLGPKLRVLGNAFRGTAVKTITIPAKVEVLGRVFDYMTIDPGNIIFKKVNGMLYNERTATLIHAFESEIPNSIAVKDGTRYIAHGVFFENNKLVTVSMPDSLIEIGNSAFEGCPNLTSVFLNEGLERINNYAFFNCEKLNFMMIPSTLTGLGYSALEDTALTSLTVPAGLYTDPDDIWYLFETIRGMPALSAVSVAAAHPLYAGYDGVVFNKDKTKVLRAPRRLSGICMLPTGTQEIADEAFEDCSMLTKLVMRDGLTTIGVGALSGTGITDLIIPNTVEEIGVQFNMNSLASITIPGSVANMGNIEYDAPASEPSGVVVYGIPGTVADELVKLHQARGWTLSPLEGGSGITSFRLKLNNQFHYGNSYSLTLWQGELANLYLDSDGEDNAVRWTLGDRKIAQVIVRDGATMVLCGGKPGTTTHTIYAADKPEVKFDVKVTVKPLSSATPNCAMLPKGLKRIETGAFRGTKYQYVYIPDGATSIGSRAFMDCPNLRVVRLPASMQDIAADAFKGCDELVLVCEEPDAVNDDLYEMSEPILVIDPENSYIFMPPYWIS